jgi:hypothetical protein
MTRFPTWAGDYLPLIFFLKPWIRPAMRGASHGYK